MYELPRGPHLLRFLNVDKATLNLPVLTGNGVGNVITIGPEIQPPNDRQIWFPVPVEGKKDYYTIIQDPASESPPGLAQAEDSNKVILSKQPDVWHLEYIPEQILDSVYKIHADSLSIGIFRLLGKEHGGHEAVIQSSPPSFPLPLFQFFFLDPSN